MKITVPLPPNIANSRMHFRVRQKAKKEYWGRLNVLAMDKRFPKPPFEAPEKVRVTVVMYLHQLMDDGNAMNRLKFLEDWLVARGYAKDDSRKHWQYTGIPEQVIDRKNPRVEISIVDAR